MTIQEAIYLLRNTAWLAPSLEPIDEAIEMACDALDKVEYINSQLGKADRKTEPTISKMEQVDKDINVRSKDEPQTDVYDYKGNGKWERVSADKYVQHAYHFYRCSKCGYDHIGKTNFCPNCGADMRGKDDE